MSRPLAVSFHSGIINIQPQARAERCAASGIGELQRCMQRGRSDVGLQSRLVCIQLLKWLVGISQWRRKGGRKGACAPGGTVQGAAFGRAKYGILKFGRFLRIGDCTAELVRREFALLVTPQLSWN